MTVTLLEVSLIAGCFMATLFGIISNASGYRKWTTSLLTILSVVCLVSFVSLQTIKLNPANLSKFPAIPIERSQDLGQGWVASYVTMHTNSHFACAEVQVEDRRYLCTMLFDARAGQLVRVHETSFLPSSGYSPVYFATRTPSIAPMPKFSKQ